MFPQHDPTRQAFHFYCELCGATENDLTAAAIQLRDHVKMIRELYEQPFGASIPYHDLYFKLAYLVAYFPYYIEPICHTLNAARISDDLFENGHIKAAFFGGGPCPEVLGLAAYLRQSAPQLTRVEMTAYDRETTWLPFQQVLVPDMLPAYASPQTKFTLQSKQCNVVDYLSDDCACSVAGSDLIISQNFLTEIYSDRARAIRTFEELVRHSGCRYLVFVENHYGKTKEMMNEIAAHLCARNLAITLFKAKTNKITPNIGLPDILRQHLFTGESRLMAKKHVYYHHIVIEIAR